MNKFGKVAVRAARDARGMHALHVPRLVSAYSTQSVALNVAFDEVRRLLNRHTSRAMAALDMAKPNLAYAMLRTLCEQHVRRAVILTRAPAVPHTMRR